MDSVTSRTTSWKPNRLCSHACQIAVMPIMAQPTGPSAEYNPDIARRTRVIPVAAVVAGIPVRLICVCRPSIPARALEKSMPRNDAALPTVPIMFGVMPRVFIMRSDCVVTVPMFTANVTYSPFRAFVSASTALSSIDSIFFFWVRSSSMRDSSCVDIDPSVSAML